jgi:hypothetical protein
MESTIRFYRKSKLNIQQVDNMAFPANSTPELDNLLRRAVDLPPERRTVIGLVESLGLGVMKAKQLQSLLATFQKDGYVAPVVEIGSLVSDEYVGSKPLQRQEPARAPLPSRAAPQPRHHQQEPAPAPAVEPAPQVDSHGADPRMARHHCEPHGHLAVMRHTCGAYLCHNCISGSTKCPICHQPLHGPKKDPPRPREPEELPVEENNNDPSEDEYHPRSDDDVKNEFGTL